MSLHESPKVVFLPGGVLPAHLAYQNLLAELGETVDARLKDLEVYAGDTPPPDFSLDVEAAGILRLANEAGFAQFHLVGYSGGGAASLVFTTRYPNRVLSLSLLEPAWAGNEGLSKEELDIQQAFRGLSGLPPAEFMRNFTRYQLRAGVSPPPPPEGSPPPWMAKRPAGLSAFLAAFDQAHLDLSALQNYRRPVYFALGGLSNPDYYGRMAERLRELFPNFTLEVYPQRHHFDPPHRAEPNKVASALWRLWRRADTE